MPRRGQQRAPPRAAPGEEPLAIRVLGELRLERGGVALPLPPSKKTRALLAWLLLEPREHTREQLCSIFWDAPDDLRGALRWSLSRLRPLVDRPGRRRLEADRERVRLDASAVEVDLLRVAALCGRGLASASRAELEQAAALFRGELLEGLELSEAFRFQAWVTAQREAARRARAQVLQALCARLSASPEEALPVARAMVSLDPADEAAHRTVMALLVALGRHREALAQYEACRAALRANFGAIPSPETEAARRAIGAPAAVPGSASVSTSVSTSVSVSASVSESASVSATPTGSDLRAPGPGSLPLLGRAAERAALEASLAPGSAGLLLLLGEPGIGKSRLLDDLAGAARARGLRVLSGRSYEAEQVRPYGCILDALAAGGLLEEADALLGRDLGALTSGEPASPGEGGRGRLFDAVAALLRTAARERPLLLLLDDAHWIDESSAALAHFLLRTAGGKGLSVAAAARGGELADNPHALRLLRALRRDKLLRELRLGPLDREAVAALLDARGLRADAARVHSESGGNPLLALELGRALAEGRPPWAGGFAEALEERFAALEAPMQALLEWPAALGRGATPELLGQVTALPLPEVLEALAALERHGLLRSLPDGSFDLAHDLFREAALRRIPAGRRRAIHAALAGALWSAPPAKRPLLAGAVARQALAAGDQPLAVRASVEAAQQALRVFAHEEARALVERALPLLPSLPREERLRAWLALSEVAVLARRPRDVERVVEDLSRLVLEAEASGLADVVAGAFHLLSKAHYDREDEQAALRGSIAAADAARGDPDPLVRARALAQAGRCLALIEREVDRAQGLLSDAAAAAASARAAVIDIPLGRGLLHAILGEEPEARAALAQAAAGAHEAGDHWRETEALFALCRSALEGGDGGAALRWAETAAPVAAKMPEGHEPALSRALVALARLQLAQERRAPDPEAAALFRAACDELRRNEARWRLSQVLLLRADQVLRDGDRAAVRALVAEARALGPVQVVQMRHARAHLVLAELALAEGDDATARTELARALAAPGQLSARLRARFSAVATAASPTPPPAPGRRS